MQITSPEQLTKGDVIYLVQLHQNWNAPKTHSYPIGAIYEITFGNIYESFGSKMPFLEGTQRVKMNIYQDKLTFATGIASEQRTLCDRSLRDMNIISQTYNDHRTFTSFEAAQMYAMEMVKPIIYITPTQELPAPPAPPTVKPRMFKGLNKFIVSRGADSK